MAPVAASAITLTNVTVAYGAHPAVHHVSGRFEPGSLTAIVGPNGAGKTSLLKAITGLRPLAGGRVDLIGLTRRDLGYLPQQADIDRSFPMRVLDFVSLGFVGKVGLFGRIGPERRAQARAALAQVGLSGFEARTLAELSTGQFQRVLFARLIVQDAPVLVLDEPFNAVDARTIADLVAMIRVWHAQGRTILIVLHDMDLARDLCSRALVVAREVLAWGPADEALRPEILARARAMAEAWDDHAPPCAADGDPQANGPGARAA